MKNRLKFLSVVLAAVMAVSCLPMFVMAEDPAVTKLNVFTGTGFTDVTADSEKLNNVTSANYGYGDGIRITPSNGDITIKDGYWPAGNRTTKVSFDYTPSTGGEHFIWLAYDAEKNNGIGIRINNQDGGLLIRAWLLIEGTAKQFGDNGAKFLAYQWCNTDALAQCKYNGKIHIEATIDYKSDTLAVITCTSTAELMEPTDDATTATVTHAVDYNLASNGGAFSNFGTASYGIIFDDANTGTNGTMLANLKVDSYASKANEFVDGHPVLSKTLDEITTVDATEVEIALSDYDAIADSTVKAFVDSTGTKEFLDAAKAKIDDAVGPVVTKLNAFTGTGFSSFSNDEAELNVSSSNYGYNLTDVVTGTEKSAILLNSTVSPDGLSAKDSYWPAGNRVTAFSFDYQATSGSANYFYFAYDKNNKNGIGFVIKADGYSNGLMIKAANSVNGAQNLVGDNSAKFICDMRYPGQNQVNCSVIAPLHIDGTVEYISDTQAKLTMTITATTADLDGTTLTANGGKTTVTGSYTYNLAFYTGFTSFGEAEYGFRFNCPNKSYLADLKVESYASKANEFIDNHSILSKTLDEVKATDETDVINALGDYDAITYSILKTLIDNTNAKAFLDAAKTKIDNETAIKKGQDYIDTYGAVIDKAATASEMTDNEAQVFGKAVDAYNALPDNVKSLEVMVAIKQRLDSYKTGVAARLKNNAEVTFDSEWVADNYFTVPEGTTTPFTYKDGYVQHSGSTVIPLAGDETTLKTVEFDYQYTSSTNLTSTFYSLYSSDGTEYKAMTSANNDGGWLFKVNGSKTIMGCTQYVTNDDPAVAYKNAFGKWNVSGEDWVNIKIDYDFSTYTVDKKVKVTYTFTYSGLYGLSWASSTDKTYDTETGTYSTVWRDIYTLTGGNASDYSFAFGNGTYNIKDLKVYTDKRAASAFERKYEGITSTDENYTSAKAEYEKLGSAQAYLTADWESVLSAPTGTVFFEDTFDNAEQSAVDWTAGTVTKTRDRTANFDNALMLSGNETATLTEAVWPKGTKPAFASITFAFESGAPVIMFGADMTKNDGTISGIGLWSEGASALKNYLCKDGVFNTHGTNDFICGSTQLMSNSGINSKVLQSTKYSASYYTTIDVAFSYTDTKVTLTYTTRIYNTETRSYLVLPSSTRSASISNITDFRPYIMADQGNNARAILKITDFKYYTAEKLAEQTEITDLGSNIYLGDANGNYKSALAFTGTVAVKDSILNKSITSGTAYAKNIGKSVTVNGADAILSTDNIPSLVRVNEIGAYVAPYKADVTDIMTEENPHVSGTAPASGVTSYGVIVNGTQDSEKPNATRLKLSAQFYIDVAGTDGSTVKRVCSDIVSSSRNGCMRRTVRYGVESGKITPSEGLSADDMLDSKKVNISDIENYMNGWLFPAETA